MFNIKKNIANILLAIYIIGGVAAIILSTIFGLNREQIGAAFLVGSFISIFISHNSQILSNYKEYETSPNFFKMSLIIWINLALFSMLVFFDSLQNYYLPLLYFLLISLMALIISIQILKTNNLSKFNIYIILSEIIITSTILSASFQYLFPSLQGNDSSFHMEYILNILNSGNIESFVNAAQYRLYPIYHISFVEIMILSKVDIKFTQFVLGFVHNLFLLFVFLIGNRLFNSKSALISTLLISLSTNILVSKYTFYPGGYSVIFFIFLLYLITSFNFSKNFYTSSLLIIIYISSIFFHPMIHFIIFFTLLIWAIFHKIIGLSIQRITTTFLSLSLILTLTQWMRPISNEGLFSALIRSITTAFEGKEEVAQATSSQFYNWEDIFMYELGVVLLVILGIAGALLILRLNTNYINKKMINIQDNRILLSIVTLIFIPLPYVLALVYPQSLPARWFPFMEVLAGIFAGVTIVFLYKRLSKHKLQSFVALILAATIFFMITSPIANPNNHIYSQNLSGRSALMDSEIYSVKFLNLVELKDLHGNSNFMMLAFNKVGVDRTKNLINPDEPESYNKGFIIVRNYDLKKGFFIQLFGAKNKLMEIILPDKAFYTHIYNINKIYTNNEVDIYLNLFILFLLN